MVKIQVILSVKTSNYRFRFDHYQKQDVAVQIEKVPD